MGFSTKTLYFAKFILIFNAVYIPALGEIGCPPEEDITPCVCTHAPTAVLRCSNIKNSEDIDSAFRHSKRYTYQEVHIENSAFQYIPRQIFENTTVKELYIVNSTVVSLFDADPKSNSVLKLHIENTLIQRFPTDNVTNFVNLESVYIDSVRIRNLTSSYGKFLPRSVKQLTIRGTGTRAIQKDAFTRFPKLDKLVVQGNQLGDDVTRDCLPRPSNVRFIYADDNQMTGLPNDAFHDMPNLQFVSLRNNKLKEFLRSAFNKNDATIPYLDLEGNPLSCDCLLLWLIKDKPEILRGTCETPSRLKGRSLHSLRPGDFNCS